MHRLSGRLVDRRVTIGISGAIPPALLDALLPGKVLRRGWEQTNVPVCSIRESYDGKP